MRWQSSSFSIRVMVALSLTSFIPFIFVVFSLLFASCYIDDGCGTIDHFVPLIVVLVALSACLLTGWLGALAAKAFSNRK